jgi:hypothetical protein
MSLWDSTAVSGGMHGMRSAVVIVATNCNAIELYIMENRVEKMTWFVAAPKSIACVFLVYIEGDLHRLWIQPSPAPSRVRNGDDWQSDGFRSPRSAASHEHR